MKKIASFQVDHTRLCPGVYLSRVDGDVVTYDIRMRTPNRPPFLENPALHTIEHLFATFARNSEYADRVIYFGPMGCRTGFYFLVRGMEHSEVLALIVRVFEQIAVFEGDIPGCSEIECGNYLEHDLAGAVTEAQKFLPIIRNLRPEDLQYL